LTPREFEPRNTELQESELPAKQQCLSMNAWQTALKMICNDFWYLVAPLACLLGTTQPVRMPCVCVSVCEWKFFFRQTLSPSWFDRSRWNLARW